MEKRVNFLDFGADNTGGTDISRAFSEACRRAVDEKAVLSRRQRNDGRGDDRQSRRQT